jgi:hypothetical protein
MHPIQIAHTHAQREASARVLHRRPSPGFQDLREVVPLAAAIPTSALASAVIHADRLPASSVIPPRVTKISRRRRRSVWARALHNHRSPIGSV